MSFHSSHSAAHRRTLHHLKLSSVYGMRNFFLFLNTAQYHMYEIHSKLHCSSVFFLSFLVYHAVPSLNDAFGRHQRKFMNNCFGALSSSFCKIIIVLTGMMEKMRDDDKDEICARGGDRGGEGRKISRIKFK